MPKRIGILGGISHASTIAYYEAIMKAYYQRFKDYYYPEIVIFSLDFQKFTDFEDQKDMDGYITYIMEGIRNLEQANVGFIIMAANSPHAVFDAVKKKAKVPLISIAEVISAHAKDQKLQKLLLLGIKFTMQSDFYQKICNRKKIDVITPNLQQQDEINKIVFDELCIGIHSAASKKRLLDIISSYDADGVILGCTELPLILEQKDSDKKFLNTLQLHAEAALEYALKK